MKHTIKSLLLAVAFLSASLSLQAATISMTVTNGTTTLSTNKSVVTLLSVSVGAVGNVTVDFYDAYLGNLGSSTNLTAPTFTNNIFVTRLSYPTNITSLYTNTLGSIQTNIATGIFTYLKTNVANTNNFPIIASVTVPASGSATFTQDLVVMRGLVAVTTTNAAVVVSYIPVQ